MRMVGRLLWSNCISVYALGYTVNNFVQVLCEQVEMF